MLQYANVKLMIDDFWLSTIDVSASGKMEWKEDWFGMEKGGREEIGGRRKNSR
jgi:hypothetical protein